MTPLRHALMSSSTLSQGGLYSASSIHPVWRGRLFWMDPFWPRKEVYSVITHGGVDVTVQWTDSPVYDRRVYRAPHDGETVPVTMSQYGERYTSELIHR